MQKATKYKMNIGIGALIALIYVLIPVDVAPDAMPVINSLGKTEVFKD